MEITKGRIKTAIKTVIYGPEGIGKTTFASSFPDPLFIDTEGSTSHMDVARLPKPTSWSLLQKEIDYVINNPTICATLVLDTADWAETLALTEICDSKKIKGIEDIGYGKGYTYLAESFGAMLNKLSEISERGVNVVVTAHAQMRKFEQPDELGAYDRWELKLQKKTAPLLKEWADMVLFANYKTMVINIDGQGAQKGKNKAQGGKRVMYTSHHPCWDAKNRFELPEELSFDFDEIAHLFAPNAPQNAAASVSEVTHDAHAENYIENIEEVITDTGSSKLDALEAFQDMLLATDATPSEIQAVVAARGYFPIDMSIAEYPEEFIRGWLIACFEQIYDYIKKELRRGTE